MAKYIQIIIDAFGKFYEESDWYQFNNSNIEKHYSA